MLPSVRCPPLERNSRRLSQHRAQLQDNFSSMVTPSYQASYGIYTVSDENFFAGTVASANALRFYGYDGPFAIIDIGFLPWMREYLRAMPNVMVLDVEPVKRHVRFTDAKTDESPVMKGWAYKAFGILHYNLFRCWTFIDADYFPLSNIEQVLRPLAEVGRFVSTEDGTNKWDIRHKEAIGVEPGSYMNINAGFITLNMEVHGSIVQEWRDLMTRRKPFGLWHGDQGALNAILDKWGVEKHVLDKVLWNQTWLNSRMAEEDKCSLVEDPGNVHLRYDPKAARIMGWHGAGWHKLWHQIGIDHYRKDNEKERTKFYAECQGKSPLPVVKIFEHFLFLDQFHQPLIRNGHLLAKKPKQRKVFIDCGVREGHAVAAFLGDRSVGNGAYHDRLLPRNDAHEFEFIGFESPGYRDKGLTCERFANISFTLVEKLVWTYDGEVAFDSDGTSYDSRILEVSRKEGGEPWRHPNPAAQVVLLPCIDFAAYVESHFSPSDYLILKVDIEGAEYDVLERMMQRGLLAWFKELYIEYHWWGRTSLRQTLEAHIRALPDVHYRNDWP